MAIKTGDLITLTFEDREFEAIVIDPDGLGKNCPSLGFGFNMMEKYGGLAKQTLSDWVTTKDQGIEGVRNNGTRRLKLPSGMALRVSEISNFQNNEYLVLEISDWVSVAIDLIKNPGKTRKATKDKLVDFLGWFAVKGFYADAYAALKGRYTEADSRAVSAWMQARLEDKTRRSRYTKFLQEQGCTDGVQYAIWTDYVYLGLFGIKKAEMVKVWELVEGDRIIGRNYIPKAEGLEAVAYCENQAIELFHTDLQQAHDDAIAFAQKKFRQILMQCPN